MPPDEFIADERRDEIEWREALHLRLTEAGFEDIGHAREAELAERALQFDEVHVGISSWVFRAMTSR